MRSALWQSTTARLAALLGALALLATPAVVPALGEVYVAPGGDPSGAGTEADPVPDIETALGIVDAGGTVNVAPGTYLLADTITITTPVTILGPQANVDPRPFSPLGPNANPGTRDLGDDSSEAILDADSQDAFSIQTSDVTINGLVITQGHIALTVGPNLLAKGGILNLTNVNVLYCGFLGDSGVGSGTGVAYRSTSDSEIAYNYIEDFNRWGILVEDQPTSIGIRYNEIADVGGLEPAIQLIDRDSAIVEFGSEILGNWIYRTGGDGIAVGESLFELTQPTKREKGLIVRPEPVDLDEDVLVSENVVGVVPGPIFRKGGPTPPAPIGGNGITVLASDAIIRGNIVTGIAANGENSVGGIVTFAGARDLAIINNTLVDIVFPGFPAGGALAVGLPSPTLEERNKSLFAQVEKGFEGDLADEVVIFNNRFVGNSPAIISAYREGLLEIVHNEFEENAPAIGVLANQGMLITDNSFALTEGPDLPNGIPGIVKGLDVEQPPLVHIFARAEGQGYAVTVTGNEIYSGTVFSDFGFDDIIIPIPLGKGAPIRQITVEGNWYGIAFDEDLDGNGIIDGLEVPQSLADSDVATTETAVVAQLDRDGDGASDASELFGQLGADFDNPDSNDDGIPDGVLFDPTNVSTPTLLLKGAVPPLPDFDIALDEDGDGFPGWYEVARFTDPNVAEDFPPLGQIVEPGTIGIADAVLALQILNGEAALSLETSENINGLNVAGTGLRTLNNPLQILRFSAMIRQGLPALPGID